MVDGDRLALWDITIGERSELCYPLPWADEPTRSHPVTSDELSAVVESSGFASEHRNDLTDQATALMQTFLALPPNPLGLHAFVTNFAQKAENLTLALADGRLRAIQAVLFRPSRNEQECRSREHHGSSEAMNAQRD